MIWGKTFKEYYGTRKVFAWFPKWLRDGRWCWLEWVWAYHDGDDWLYSLENPDA